MSESVYVIYVYTCVHAWMHVYIHVCMYACICMYVCMYVRTNIHMYIINKFIFEILFLSIKKINN